MEKLHFDDLTAITCPFGMLDEDTQKRLLACERLQAFKNGWENVGKIDFAWPSMAYRAAPEPLRPISIPWDAVDDKWNWAARDEDGNVFLFNFEPVFDRCVWIEGSKRFSDSTGIQCLKHDPGNTPCQESLIMRPGYTGE